MKALVINDHGEMTLECKDMSFENGFIVFEKEDGSELFVSPAKVIMMEVEGRTKKKEKKVKKSPVT